VTDPLAPLLDLPGVLDSVASARSAVDALLGNRALRRRSPDVSAESLVRGGWASAVLSGAQVELADVRAGTSPAIDDPLVQGALRVQGGIGPLADPWARAPRQVFARLHGLAAADLVEDRMLLGRPAPEASGRLDTLARVLVATTAPAVVVAAIVHGEILGLDAFGAASGIVARAAVRLTLVDRGLDPKSLVVVEVGHLELRAEYADALDAYRGGTPAGLAHWLRHCADAVIAGAQDAVAICEALQRAS
jgi:hypothetical protein